MAYSTLPFHTLRRSVDLLTSGPGEPVLDVHGLAGTAYHAIGAGKLGQWLRQLPLADADEVWRRMISRVRGGDATWTVVAAGLALPGLYAARRSLSRGLEHELADLEAEMLAALVQHMRTMDLREEAVCGRLVYAARKAGMRYRYAQLRSQQRELRLEPVAHKASTASSRGPVSVLAEAIESGVVSTTEAELIARTHLEGQTLGCAAKEMGLTYITARRYRRRAQTQLAAAVGGEKPSA
ncbi:molybdenum-dependent DNA-binding transcriptional regulator ModE [Nocardiopsis mwathae]|uniref:Molybdenum-dependent DNA-binding transcriptional regulator ModE n=1 Tax=Nocardiopsis mwathae TaxID=1472723 RepID=A0A7W9YMM4_9ACTN|nr:hypothetical protein [Nocardiopsis mwathae]MBB6174968.1 molybdenum-dependent DNA-binding transcriptional regulator ModE [Nocardiopsis mwathae]